MCGPTKMRVKDPFQQSLVPLNQRCGPKEIRVKDSFHNITTLFLYYQFIDRKKKKEKNKLEFKIQNKIKR
jgi:hypothetical protein